MRIFLSCGGVDWCCPAISSFLVTWICSNISVNRASPINRGTCPARPFWRMGEGMKNGSGGGGGGVN